MQVREDLAHQIGRTVHSVRFAHLIEVLGKKKEKVRLRNKLVQLLPLGTNAIDPA